MSNFALMPDLLKERELREEDVSIVKQTKTTYSALLLGLAYLPGYWEESAVSLPSLLMMLTSKLFYFILKVM